MHVEAHQYVEQKARGRFFKRVLEFGSLNINGTVKELFSFEHYHGIDLQRGPGVDEIADAVSYRAQEQADCVVCCEVLEHAPDVYGIVQSAYFNLEPGGLFIMTCAADPRAPHSAVDGGHLRDGEHYRNVKPWYFEACCIKAGFKGVEVEVDRVHGDLYGMAWK